MTDHSLTKWARLAFPVTDVWTSYASWREALRRTITSVLFLTRMGNSTWSWDNIKRPNQGHPTKYLTSVHRMHPGHKQRQRNCRRVETRDRWSLNAVWGLGLDGRTEKWQERDTWWVVNKAWSSIRHWQIHQRVVRRSLAVVTTRGYASWWKVSTLDDTRWTVQRNASTSVKLLK